MKKITWILMIATFILVSCKNKDSSRLMTNVTGKAGEVVIVIEPGMWNSNIGVEFRRKLAQDYPGLPQAEPLFDLVHIPYSAFSNIFKTHRNILLVKVSNEYDEPKMIIQKNLYAKPQIVINILAPDDSSMEALIRDKGDLIVDRLLKKEMSRYASNYTKYEDKTVGERLEKKFGINITIPKGFKIDMDTTDFVWVANDSPAMSQGLLIFSYDKPDVELTTPYIIAKRNQFTSQFVKGENPNSFMIVEQEVEPFRREIVINKLKVTELRSLWRVEGDFMGGPFVSFTFVDDKKNKVIHADGFVYAPQFDKRDYIRQLEAILNSVKLK
ncbi:MAG: hypothetical protein A2X13_05645 [Bacteroidetes bacterium GWC2_33_15]|nr:MAG: hypothetical protein A2X10_00330 [Bacteroidetes bacterium GWA2_33_15]OFX51976.1 MAG: hypothetical protein A2X13_05645 [Bacteroidetes bacterium GWC2_33_15]OFX63806.1 MAG: hypothetical protein A2X15_00570 [Bacteroidetes bacterium GWB2_32_14]OFX67379.1 MAG: hypothetical protein A2X14_12375 [Bacteroidetes bacterium GWD2_33_33]HAN17859.1 hypothetical protein [Bacteroidales bacterium]